MEKDVVIREDKVDMKPSYPTIWQSLKFIGFYMLISFVMSMLAGISNLMVKFPNNTQITGIISTLFAFTVLMAWVWRKLDLSLRDIFARNHFLYKSIIPVVFAVLGANILLSEADNVLRTFIPMGEAFTKVFNDLFHGGNVYLSFISTAIIAPLTEEIMFRGVILRGFIKKYPVKKAVLVSAFLFGLIHFNIWQFTGALVWGIIAGWIYVKTRSLLPCILGHAVHNSMPFIVGNIIKVEIPGYSSASAPGVVLHQALCVSHSKSPKSASSSFFPVGSNGSQSEPYSAIVIFLISSASFSSDLSL